MKQNNIVKIFMLIIIVVLVVERAVAKDYVVVSSGKTIVTISPQGVNRIGVESDRIARIIGNEAEYIIDSDGDLGQIFITPTLKVGQQISATIVTEQGKQIDARFDVTNTPPQTVLFKFESNKLKQLKTSSLGVVPTMKQSHINNNITGEADFKQEIIELIRNARENKFTSTTISKLPCLLKHRSLKFLSGYEYINDKYFVMKLAIQNKDEQKIALEESEFTHCLNGVVAIALENSILEPKAVTKLYLVGKND